MKILTLSLTLLIISTAIAEHRRYRDMDHRSDRRFKSRRSYKWKRRWVNPYYLNLTQYQISRSMRDFAPECISKWNNDISRIRNLGNEVANAFSVSERSAARANIQFRRLEKTKWNLNMEKWCIKNGWIIGLSIYDYNFLEEDLETMKKSVKCGLKLKKVTNALDRYNAAVTSAKPEVDITDLLIDYKYALAEITENANCLQTPYIDLEAFTEEFDSVKEVLH